MDRRDDEEGISGGRFTPAANNLLPPTRKFRLQTQVGYEWDNSYPIAALADSTGTLKNIRWQNPTTGAVITEAAAGDAIVLVVDWDAYCPTSGLSWKACCTAMEQGGIPLASAWKNYVNANTSGPDSSSKSNMKLNQMPGGSLVMPARNLTVVVKLWVRGDLNQDYPEVSEAWRS